MMIWRLEIALMLAMSSTILAQSGTSVQQTFAQMQEASGKNQLVLRNYQWKETVSVTDGDHQAPPRTSLCRYAADGTVLKTPLGSTGESRQAGVGPLRHHVMEKKEEEVADVGQVAEQYLPPSPDRLRDAVASGKIITDHDPTGSPELVFADYQKAGDQMKLVLDPVSK